ncbi:MAG: HU family DNA-binding protein [Tannerellaceae bacterium]|nr:HU family DNA-binding protein [Tannerellaceae bacterium]MCD8264040.1 HU family DNA-binding protein [Tannerellaceae bacterium]
MALTVSVVKRKVPSGEHAGEEMFFGQVRASGTTSFDELCNRISGFSSATRGDVELVLNGFLMVVGNHLDNGNLVEMGKLGTIRMSAGSRGTETEEEFTAHQMKTGHIVFKPGKYLKRVVEEATFRRIDKKVVIVECTRLHTNG